jgi:YVTN family beta-propeller protein
VVVSSSGNTHSATEADHDPDTAEVASKPRKSSTASQLRAKASATAATARTTARVAGQSAREAHAAKSAPAEHTATPSRHVADSITTAVTLSTMSATPTSPSATSPVPARQAPVKAAVSPISAVVNSFVQPILSSFFGATPGGTPESPLGWVFLAAARRQLGLAQESTEATSTVAGARTTTALAAAAAADAPPTVSPTFGTPDPVTGTVTGQLNASDPEGQPLAVAVTTQPTSGTLVFANSNGNFTFTPTTSQRITAGVTTGVDTIAMTVTVSDGTTTVPVVVNIPVSPAAITKTGDVTAIGPDAVVATNNRAYVTNKSAGTVTVIDTTTNTVIGTINVGATPDGVVLKPDGSRLYVSSTAGNTVTVVNTTSNTVVTTIAVAKPTAMAINSSGSVLYVANYDAGTVTRITTATNTASSTAVTLPTGSHPTEITVSPDKAKIYVLSTKADGTTSVSAFALSS